MMFHDVDVQFELPMPPPTSATNVLVGALMLAEAWAESDPTAWDGDDPEAFALSTVQGEIAGDEVEPSWFVEFAMGLSENLSTKSLREAWGEACERFVHPKVIGLQVVSIHQGSDWGVMDIREGEPFDPAEDYQLADHAKACAVAARLAREFKCNWFDLSTVEEK
jgi:hypothetical protein